MAENESVDDMDVNVLYRGPTARQSEAGSLSGLQAHFSSNPATSLRGWGYGVGGWGEVITSPSATNTTPSRSGGGGGGELRKPGCESAVDYLAGFVYKKYKNKNQQRID